MTEPIDYLARLAQLYLDAPEGTEEERLLEFALARACERLEREPEEVLL
jgi:hypothetical protein